MVNALAAEAEAIVQALQQAPDSLALEAEGKSLLATIEALEQQLESRLVAIDREQAASKQSVTAMNREEIKREIRKLKDEYRDNNRLFLGGDNSAILDRHLLARNQFLKQELIRLRAIRGESSDHSYPDDNYYNRQEATNRVEVVKGVGDAVVDTVEGICNTLVQLAEDPSVVIGDLINAVKAIPELPVKLKAYLSDVEAMNEEEQSRELGKFIGNVCMLLASCSFKTKGTPAGKTPTRGTAKVKEKFNKQGNKGTWAGPSGVSKIQNILNNPESLKGMSAKDVVMRIDKDMSKGWVRDTIKKGRGVRWYDGKGNEIRINYGCDGAILGKGHGGPYIRVSTNGERKGTLLI